MDSVLKFASEKINLGEKVVLVTLTEKTVGAPGAEGQIMVVLEDGTIKGTVGGGITEYKLIARSIEAIKNNEKTFNFDFDLTKEGLLCGGKIKGFGNVMGVGNRLIIFGGGHIAQRLAPLASIIGMPVTIVEDREDLEKYFNSVDFVLSNMEDEDLNKKIKINDKVFIVICTRGHKQDYTALKYCIEKSYAYLGMIGSKSKVKSTFKKLNDEGYEKEIAEKIYAPIGLDFSDGTPVEIAMSIMSEILVVKNNGKLEHMKNKINL